MIVTASAQGIYRRFEGITRWCVLPEAQHLPAMLLKVSNRSRVALAVLDELLRPPGAVGSRHLAVIGAAVPEAPVDEDGNLLAREGDVDRTTWEVRNWILDPVSASGGMQESAERDLWSGVAPRVSAHPGGDPG
jgi:hypothetical protein